jgi:hypothetical protein
MSGEDAPEIDGSAIFNIAPVQFQTELNNISALTVSNDILVIGFKTCNLFRIDLQNPTIIEELELPFKRSVQELGKIEKLFLDPLGNHLIVTTNRNENFYIHKSSKVFKPLNDFKNVNISSVAWNVHAVSVSNTGAFLVGDKSGHIHEGFVEYIETGSKFNKKFQKVSYHSKSPIDGLSVDYDEKLNKLTVVVISGDDIGYWHDDIRRKNAKYNDFILGDIFKNTSPVEFEKYQDLGNINGQKFTSHELGLGWLTLPGIVYGKISMDKIKSKRNISEFKFLVNVELPESKHKFKSVVLTKYHLLLLRGSELLCINKLNDELVYHQSLPLSDNERFIGISADYTQGTYWIYSNVNIYEVTVDDEERDIWKALVENNEYDQALAVTDDVDVKDVIFSKQGDYLFEREDFIQAAKSYANSSRSFETVSLKFLELEENNALLEYFITKFSILKNDTRFDFKMQLVMLSSWIVELFIVKLTDIDEALLTEHSSNLEEKTLLKTSTEKRFQEFLINNKDTLDKDTIYEIITSHNRQSELLYYANLTSDFDFILAYWIRLENWTEALKILEKNNEPESVYKYSTVLLVNAPGATVDSWLRFTNLDPAKLLPAILTYNKSSRKVKYSNHQGIRYLTTHIREFDSSDSIVHDSLLYLLVSNESTTEEDTLLTYLKEQGSNVSYNSDFILRLCLRFNKIKSAVLIYSNLNFYEDAVNLALENDLIDLAMITADRPEEDKTRKYLWLKIAKKRTSLLRPNENDNIAQEVRLLLEKCELLTIKDLLPLLPDFTTIDSIKDEICDDLENFGTLINTLTLEMNQSIEINNNITKDLNTYKEKSQIIKNGESCAHCEFLLTTRKFFIFPCNHAFHSDCLIKEILGSNDYGTKKRLEFLQKRYLLKKHNKNDRFINDAEVDDLLCKRCPLCSDLKIETVDLSITANPASRNDWDI